MLLVVERERKRKRKRKREKERKREREEREREREKTSRLYHMGRLNRSELFSRISMAMISPRSRNRCCTRALSGDNESSGK